MASPDAKIGALAIFTRIIVEKRGLPFQAESDAFMSARFTLRQMMGMALAIAVMTLSNCADHRVDTPLDAELSVCAIAAQATARDRARDHARRVPPTYDRAAPVAGVGHVARIGGAFASAPEGPPNAGLAQGRCATFRPRLKSLPQCGNCCLTLG